MVSHAFVYGYSTIEAWNSCNRAATGEKTAKLVAAVMLPALLCVVMNYVFIIFALAKWAVIVIRIVVYAFAIAYYVTFALTIMFEFSQFERRDIERKSWEV
jgi:fatty acid desaturase